MPDLDFPVLGPREHAMIIGAPWADAFMAEITERHFPGARRGFTLVSLVVPGQTIPEHVDDHDGGCRVRLHVPLTTDAECRFLSDGIATHLAQGFVWRIDPGTPHGVEHRGTRDRIHLMWNVITGKDD